MALERKSEIRNDTRALDDKKHMRSAKWEEMRRLFGQLLTIAIVIGIFVGLWIGASAIMDRAEEEPPAAEDQREDVNYI